jgi:hypothetical protein
MRISAAAGARAAYLSDAVDFADPGEYLLGRGSKFRVDGWDAGTRELSVTLE